jgi:hypothetical protein
MLCPEANPGRRGGKPVSNRLSYGTAYDGILIKLLSFWTIIYCFKYIIKDSDNGVLHSELLGFFGTYSIVRYSRN